MLKTNPMDHQWKFLDFVRTNKWIYCGDEMGLGKSLQALMVLDLIDGKDAIIICPAMLRDNWLGEIEKHTGYKGSKSLERKDINVISYEAMTKNPSLLSNRKLIVFDEAHYIAKITAKRTKMAHIAVKEDTEYVILMSGTPITNRVPDLYSPLKLLNKYHGGFTLNFNQFCRIFTFETSFVVRGRRISKFTGVREKPQLKKLMKGKFIRRLASSVLTLPKSSRQYIPANLPKGDYEQELIDAWEAVAGGKKGHNSTAKKKSAIAKVPFTLKFIENILENDEICIVFSDHPDVLHTLEESLSKGYRVGLIDGNTNMDLRVPMANKFQNGELDILLLSIPAASTGLTLTRSRICIFNDASWIPANNKQAEKRIDRIGQTRPVINYYITGSKIDENITRTNAEKSEDASIVDE